MRCADPRLFSSDNRSLTQRELLKTGLWTRLWLMAHCYNTQDKDRYPGENIGLRLNRELDPRVCQTEKKAPSLRGNNWIYSVCASACEVYAKCGT